MKNAVVIGGLSGVGKGIAKALADREFNVIIGDVNIGMSSRSDSLYFVDAVRAESVKEAQRQGRHHLGLRDEFEKLYLALL